jgi:hypothetical protein
MVTISLLVRVSVRHCDHRSIVTEVIPRRGDGILQPIRSALVGGLIDYPAVNRLRGFAKSLVCGHDRGEQSGSRFVGRGG